MHALLWAQIVLCSACSGHGFKFCSVIGEMLADLAMTGTTKHAMDLHNISADRPGHESMLQRFHDKAHRNHLQAVNGMHKYSDVVA